MKIYVNSWQIIKRYFPETPETPEYPEYPENPENPGQKNNYIFFALLCRYGNSFEDS